MVKVNRRLILVPQYPTKMRYQEWWYTEFPIHFSEFFEEVIVLGKTIIPDVDYSESEFAPKQAAIDFELQQIQEFLELDLRDDDILLVMDISYPGLFCSILFHKKLKRQNMFAICHGTSKNNYDIFSEMQAAKFPIESAYASLFNNVFVASNYHWYKVRWDNAVAISFPYPPFEGIQSLKFGKVISVARNTKQKRTPEIEKYVENTLDITIDNFEGRHFAFWKDYYFELSKYKVMFISAKEETFGYQVIDALKCGVIPIAPNKFSYPELLPQKYLYDTKEEAAQLVHYALLGRLEIPEFTTYDIFYLSLIGYMIKK